MDLAPDSTGFPHIGFTCYAEHVRKLGFRRRLHDRDDGGLGGADLDGVSLRIETLAAVTGREQGEAGSPDQGSMRGKRVREDHEIPFVEKKSQQVMWPWVYLSR